MILGDHYYKESSARTNSEGAKQMISHLKEVGSLWTNGGNEGNVTFKNRFGVFRK